MNHVDMLSKELGKQGWSQHSFSEHMGWHKEKMNRWKLGRQSPWISQMEDCWQALGFTLLPARLPSITPRLSSGGNDRPLRTISSSHKLVTMLFIEMDDRRLMRQEVLEIAGLAHDTFRVWARDPRGGRTSSVEACWNVMGMSMIPFPISTLGAIHAAA